MSQSESEMNLPYRGPSRKPPLLTDAQCLALERLEEAFSMTRDGLTVWEEEFLGDILIRFRLFGDRTILSPKQWGHVTRISGKIV